jgi:transcriptional regulator with XRE-family HTH domain
MQLSGAQCRAARGWLRWSRKRLAGESRVSLKTIANLEDGRSETTRPNRDALRRALEGEGVEFLFDADGRPAGIAGSARPPVPAPRGAAAPAVADEVEDWGATA